MVEFFENDIITMNRNSSKGNQLKFQRDGMWYKADYTGYEGLVEYIVSKLLKCSSLLPDEFVDYDLEQIEYNGQVFNACKSRDFANGWQLITLERLFQQSYGYSLHKMLYSTPVHSDRLRYLVEQTERLTGIPEFGKYMNKVLTIDALFLNEDRHTHNLAVLTKEMKDFKLAPIFDNGAGLLSDTTMDYPMGKETIDLIAKVRGATFCEDLEEQMDVSEQLYGRSIRFTFTYHDVERLMDQITNYPEEIITRVTDVIAEMRRRYQYLF